MAHRVAYRQDGRRRPVLLLGLSLLLLSSLACERGPDEAYVTASDRLGMAERALARREKDLAASEAAARTATQRLEEDRKALIRARQGLAEAEGRLGRVATDQVLFRAIQRELLEDARLRDSAISVQVDGGVVTLTGRVASARLRERALERVQSARGVRRVEDRLEIAASTPRG